MDDREQELRAAKLADSLILTAAEFRARAVDEAQTVAEGAAWVTAAAHIEAQVDSYRSTLDDPCGPDWERVAHLLAAALADLEPASLAYIEYLEKARPG